MSELALGLLVETTPLSLGPSTSTWALLIVGSVGRSGLLIKVLRVNAHTDVDGASLRDAKGTL